MLRKYGRGLHLATCERKLSEICVEIWLKGRQQCEVLSLRGNSCAMPKHDSTDPTGHSSNETIISTCNCGRTQGRRTDPFTLRQANYEFYQFIAGSCSMCPKLENVSFSVFKPSSSEYRLVVFFTPFIWI